MHLRNPRCHLLGLCDNFGSDRGTELSRLSSRTHVRWCGGCVAASPSSAQPGEQARRFATSSSKSRNASTLLPVANRSSETGLYSLSRAEPVGSLEEPGVHRPAHPRAGRRQESLIRARLHLRGLRRSFGASAVLLRPCQCRRTA